MIYITILLIDIEIKIYIIVKVYKICDKENKNYNCKGLHVKSNKKR